MKKRILSMLLALTMLVGMIPATTLTANALIYTGVDTWEELVEELTTGDAGYILLEADINLSHENNPEGLVDFETIEINGTKTLDLNGHSIEVKDRETGTIYDTLFKIPADSQLTINDGIGDGQITYKTYFPDIRDFSFVATSEYHKVRKRDIFDVHGTLVVNGGKILAGDVEKKWVTDGAKDPIVDDWDSYWTVKVKADRYDGYARQQTWGTAANVYGSGTLVVNGGELAGRGFGWTSGLKDDNEIGGISRDAVVEISGGGTVLVNGGSFKANGGANVFAGDGVASGLTVCGGYFKTDKHDYIICPGPSQVNRFPLAGACSTLVETGSYGHLGIPDSAWKNVPFRIQVIQNGTTLTGYDKLNALSLDKTGGQTSGDSLEVTILPYVSGKMPLTVNGGPYNNSLSADTTYKINYTDIDVTADYEPYYKDTTGLENYSITYNWSVYNDDPLDELEFYTTTTTNTLNILEALKANINQYAHSFSGTLTVKCTVVEQTSNGSFLPIITEFYSAKFKDVKTPLTEDALPGGKMDTVITYPDGSSGKAPVLITVNPLASQLADEAYGSCTVEYQYNFRSWRGETITDYSSTGKLDSFGLDYGHVKVATTMIVYGSDGISRRFTDEAWALVLPEITPTRGTWDSDKTVIIGNPGTPVTLNAPIDTTNASVAADKITASDIVGWYKITYNSSGAPVYSLIGNGGTTQLVSENGTYCYAAKDRDGNKVYSAPVKVQFSADAYSIKITRTPADYSFYVCPDWANPVAQDITFTATIGSSVAKSNVWWKIVNAPQGFDISTMTSSPGIINATNGLTPSFSDFIKTDAYLKSIPVGTYAVQAFVYKDGSYLSASNIIYVDVRRAESFVDITDAYGNVLSETTMEGPASGTMQLNCVPGNGGSNPVLKSVTWKVESLVGTNVATIDQNGLLTINKPGQIKVTATVTQENGEMITLNSNTQYVIINIPITEVEVTLGTPTVGGDPHSIASVPADAPYELNYSKKYSWSSGVNNDVFYANGIPELCVTIAPKDGYVFPARQLYLENYDESWYTYADDMVVKVNGTSYNFRDFETTYTDGSSEYNGDYGTWYEAQSIDFYWTWDRLRSADDKYLDYVNLSVTTPTVGSVEDTSAFNLACSNNTYANSNSIIGSVYKVSGDYLNDGDISNDNAVSMASGETYQQGQMYRVTIMANVGGAYTSPAQYFEEQVTAIVNNENCIVESFTGSTLEGDYMACVYYYFMPKAEVQTISELYIAGLSTPVGYSKPVTADSITEITSNFVVGDEVYVTRLQWFVDSNNNNVIDSGEDSADFFNADGSFITGLRYSVHIELEARDRDGDGKGDYVKFADNVTIKLTDMSYATMTGNQNGAVYKFAAATAPAKAVTADPASVTINLEEGYSGRPITYINLASVGTTTVTSVVAVEGDTDLIDVSCDGMTVAVMPDGGLAVGQYTTVIYIQDEYGSVYTTIPVTINVGVEEEPDVLKGDVNLDGVVDMKDAAALQRHVLKMTEITDANALAVAELTGDGIIDMKDAAKLTQYAIKMIDSLD